MSLLLIGVEVNWKYNEKTDVKESKINKEMEFYTILNIQLMSYGWGIQYMGTFIVSAHAGTSLSR